MLFVSLTMMNIMKFLENNIVSLSAVEDFNSNKTSYFCNT